MKSNLFVACVLLAFSTATVGLGGDQAYIQETSLFFYTGQSGQTWQGGGYIHLTGGSGNEKDLMLCTDETDNVISMYAPSSEGANPPIRSVQCTSGNATVGVAVVASDDDWGSFGIYLYQDDDDDGVLDPGDDLLDYCGVGFVGV